MSERVSIRRVTRDDRNEWLRMRRALWPDCRDDKQAHEMTEYLADRRHRSVFVAELKNGHLRGFLEATLRPEAPGCESTPVGYLEGWYVDPDARKRGVGRRLVAAAERWARSLGCSEVASDCALDNSVSRAAHRALGYEEVERLIHFRRRLGRTRGRRTSTP